MRTLHMMMIFDHSNIGQGKIIMPTSPRQAVLKELYADNLSFSKCLHRAQQTIYLP